MREFQAVADGGKAVPDQFKALSLLQIGRVHDLAGRRDQAVKAYQKVVDQYDKQAAAGAARVGLVTPYRRPSPRAIGQPRQHG